MINTFKAVEVVFLQALVEVQEIQKRGWRVLPMTRAVKEEQLGRCCYLAEEFLSSSDLYELKVKAKLDERMWRHYKERVSGQ
jgi:hypothetical protein